MKYKLILFLVLLVMPFSVNALTLNLFYGKECPHCEAEQQYLKELEKKYDDLEIKKYEVWHDEENSKLLEKVRKELNDDATGVPYTVIGTTGITGFNDNTKAQIEKLLKEDTVDAVSYIKEDKEIPKTEEKKDTDVTVPILGKIDATDVSLPILAMILGLIDGFNPCAMWVLLFLLTMLVQMKNKKRMIALGLIFILTSGLMYAAIMCAWLGIAINAMQQVLLRSIIAVIALIAGILNIRSYLKERKDPSGCTVTNDKQRIKILAKIKKFTKEKSFILAALGIIALAVSVNLVELACSAGLPLLFTSVLAMNDLNALEYAFNILLYIVFFLLDDIIVFIIAVKTLEITGFSTKYSKYSHLIGGIIMILIGLLLLIKPEWIMLNF